MQRGGRRARALERREPGTDIGAAADLALQKAFGGEPFVGFADRLARYLQAFGEKAHRRQAVAGGQAAVENGGAQLAVELAGQVLAAVEGQMELHRIGYLLFP